MRPMGFISRHSIVPAIAAFLVTASLALPASAWALDDASARATLKGIKAIRLAVAPVKPDISQAGFTTAAAPDRYRGAPQASRDPRGLSVGGNVSSWR